MTNTDAIPEAAMTAREPHRAEIAVEIESSLADVWASLTTDVGLALWMGRGSHVELVEGGELRVADVATGRTRCGAIRAFEPERYLAFTWWPEDDPADRSQVSIAIEPCGAGTRVTVTESASPTGSPIAAAMTGGVGPTSEAVGTEASADRVLVAVGSWSWRLAMLVLAVPALVLATAPVGAA